MKRGLGALLIGSVVLLASACATSVAGTAQVGPAAAVPSSPALTSLGGVTQRSAPSSFPDSTGLSSPSSEPVPGSSAGLPTDNSEPASTEPPTAGSTQAEESTTAPPTSTRPTPTTSKPVSRPTKLSCKSGSLTPSGGAFCYQIPDGFTDTSSTATYPGTDKVRSAIQPSDASGSARDLIFVTATTLSVNSDDLSDSLIKASLEQALKSNSNSTSTALVQTTVAGDRAFETTLKFADGVMQRYLLVFSGKTRVAVSCQWRDAKTVITTACKTVLSTMQIRNP
ncbi:hypothetical protein SAMN04515671_1480 [Nakamurella panacisegetis]|uniref:PknH-like extracellular domain-containing protein n=1 Tax=Nakamurella panacisegetis TaxID=1090615 RepID=A0A1H0KZ34_9ACTN|nr:hypothetical protein [Nakamurella panacisegetis]SDO61033.1 hypothetical protein SAMN04515671_1480 [Nakamurella panacisegetis]